MNFSSLGIPVTDQTRVPTADTFPLTFDPKTQKLWPIAVGQTLEKEPKKAWEACILTFVKLCEKSNLSPFSSFGISNDDILTTLIRSRRLIVKFMERSGVIEDMKIFKTLRKVTMTSTGFSLRVDVHSRNMKEDPQILTRMGIRKESSLGNMWSRGLDSNIDFFVYNEGALLSQRWHFGYEIRVDKFPYVPGVHLPSNQQLEKFVLDVLYMPILKAYRPFGGYTRLV